MFSSLLKPASFTSTGVSFEMKENYPIAVYNNMKFDKYPSTRGTQRAIRRDSDCVQEATVTNVVGLQLAVGQVPHLRAKEERLSYTYACIKIIQSSMDCTLKQKKDDQ